MFDSVDKIVKIYNINITLHASITLLPQIGSRNRYPFPSQTKKALNMTCQHNRNFLFLSCSGPFMSNSLQNDTCFWIIMNANIGK